MINYDSKKLFLTFLLAGVILFLKSISVSAADCDNMPTDTREQTEEKIKCLSQKVGQLGSQANTLKNQISQFDYQIKLTTLKITQTQAQIDLLGGRIDQLTTSLDELSKAFSSRAVETYKLARFENNFFFVMSARDVTDAASRYHYLQKIEEEDRKLLTRLQNVQTTYQGQKADQESLQKQLEEEKSKLNTQKSAKNNLLTATKNDEAKYQSLLSQARAQLERFRNFVVSQGGSSILSNQTKCTSWGCYYNQRDSQWGNMSLGGSGYFMKDSGCFITSVAMMASHVGKNIKPSDIAQISAAVTSGGDLKWAFDVNGTHVSISSASAGSLDSMLGSGPVIAGLYLTGGRTPDHFIVILRKEGDKYIMNDPFMENGSERPLTDKYSNSNIGTLRVISFN